ncbi:MAG: alpha-amylase family protein, partial [Armatimonadota bacterium]
DDDATYRLAAGGMKSLGDGPRPWTAPDDLPDALRNPVKHDYADLSNPAAWPYLERMWRKLGTDLNANPVFPLLHITGEEMVLYQGGLCPTEAADADFRDWVKGRYGTLDAVSEAWGRPVKSWGEIEQIISARMVRERLVQVEKEQEKRLDWLGAADKLNAEQGAFLKADPGRGMDWLRWRNDLYLRSVERLAKVFHEVNPTTLLCNHFCWPNFVPQTTYGLARRLDALGIDTQYPCGLPGSLGTPAETIDMMGMYEAFADRKPVWGMEIYIQPKFPAPMPATQVWGFIAHGMRMVNNFAWKPYSDAGQNAKRWNEPGAPPWWFIIDFDGKHMPQFDPLVRATREVNAFDARYGGHTLSRAKPDAAYFVSSDAGVLSHFETLGQWWSSSVTHARCELGWLLRLAGVSLDYLDDELLAERLKDYRVVFVPYSPNVRERSLQRLADFAKAGGTVVFAGPCGWQDPWLKARANVGGKAFAELQWKVTDYAPKAAGTVAGVGPLRTVEALTAMTGLGQSELAGGTAVMQDASGKAYGWSKPLGKGRVLALTAYPSAYSQSPHADAGNLDFVRKLAAAAGVAPRASWHCEVPPTPEKLAGEGAPVVDVMLRQKSDRELFLFVMNIGGQGTGEVRLNLGKGWQLTDALTQARVPITGDRLPLALKAWEYRVIRLTR